MDQIIKIGIWIAGAIFVCLVWLLGKEDYR